MASLWAAVHQTCWKELSVTHQYRGHATSPRPFCHLQALRSSQPYLYPLWVLLRGTRGCGQLFLLQMFLRGESYSRSGSKGKVKSSTCLLCPSYGTVGHRVWGPAGWGGACMSAVELLTTIQVLNVGRHPSPRPPPSSRVP